MNRITKIIFVAFGLFCGAFANVAQGQGSPLMSPDSLIDFRNNHFCGMHKHFENVMQGRLTGSAPSCTPGYIHRAAFILSNSAAIVPYFNSTFIVYYEDATITGQQTGFYDPIDGLARRTVLERVLGYVKSQFSIADNANIEIYLYRSLVPAIFPANPICHDFLAAAYPIAPGDSPTSGVYKNNMYRHITEGHDPDSDQYDGFMIVNFDRVATLPITYYTGTDLLNPNPCDLDLFMLLLHEMGHNLGFYSLIQKNASNQAVSTYPSIFSLFDWHFLHTGDIKTTAEMNKFVTGTLTAPQINPDVNAGTAPEPLKYGNIWLYKQGGSNIHSPSSGDNQSSVSLPTQFNQPMTNTSHLDNNQTSFTNRLQFSPGFAPAYIMNSGMAPADAARQFSPQELRIFAQLGYTINPTVSPNLTNHPPHNTKVQETAIYEHIDPPGVFGLIHNYFDACSSQHRDQETFFAEREGAVTPWVLNYLLPTRTTIIQLSQLGVADSDGDLVSIAPNSFYVIQGSCCGNAITHTTSSITVTAGEYYHGLIQVGFRLYDGKDVGDFTTLTVKVTPSTHTSYPANLVLNGDYEAGTEVKTGLTFNDFQNSPIPNSPQQFIREAQYCRGRIFADAHPFFSTSWIYAGSGVVTKNSAFAQTCRGGAWRSNPFGYILTSTPSSTTGGGYAIPDPTPTGGNRFDIGYEFYSTLVKPMEKCKVYKLKCQLNTNILAGATSGQETPMTIYFLPTANCDYYSSANPVFQTTWNVPANSSWQDIEHIFKFCPNSATALPAYYMVIYANEQHITIDNISLEEVVNPPPMTVVLSAPATTVGQSAWLPITATVNPPGCALHYQWSLPAGSTDPCLTSGTCPTITVSPAVNTTYTVTVTSGTLAGCVTTATASIMITVSNCQQPRPTITASPQGVRCGGLSTALTAINPIHATTTFTWSNNTTGASTTVSPTVNTIYTVTATANGCSSTATYRVAVFDSPHFTLTPNNDGICPVNPTIISVNTIDHLALNWGNSTGPILNGPSLTVNTQGTYTVTATMVTGGHQCTATQSITISNGMPPQNLTITQGTYDMCNGINLTASAAYLYAWNTGDYTQMITTNPYPEATYTVTATALNGCTATASTIIRVYNSPVWNGFIRVGDAFGCPTASAAIVDYQHLFNATTHTFTSSDPIIVAGSFTIDQNFATENTEWVMLPGAKLVVQPYRTLTLNAGTEFHAAPCGRLWQGIVVNSRGRLVTTGTQAPFGSWQNGVLTSLTVPNIDGSKANNVVLRDAYRAIEAQNMARVSLDYTAFSNNYNGLYFDGNAATGTRALIMEKMHNCLFYQDFDDLLNPYDPALPYNINAEAGIKVKNAAYINLNPTNSFDEMGTLFTGALQRGIALDNTTMRVGNLTFSELLTESQNNPLAHGVDPIGIDAVNNSRLAYTGTPSLRFQNNTFSHKDFCILNTAVHSQSSSVVLDGVTTIDFVIRSNLPTFLHAEGTNSAVTVKNCILHSIDEQAIWIDNTTNMSKLLIENNLIEMTQDIHFPTHILFPNARGAIMVAGTNVLPDPRDPIQPTLRIANNTISTGASPAGIRVVGFNGLHINNNTVVLQSFLATREGIGLTNTSQTTLSCNNIRGEGAYSTTYPYTTPTGASVFSPRPGQGVTPDLQYEPIAIRLSMATSTTLSCNRTDNTYTGILAQGNCSGTVQNPTRIVTNSFGVHHWALNYTGSLLLTDEQIRANNTWDAQFYPAISTNRFAARHQGVPSSWGGDLPGVFKVDRGTAELPPNFAPFQAGVTNLQWFRNEPNGAKQICARPNNYTCISPFSLTAPTGSSLTEKEALAIGAVQTAEYPNEMLKWAQRSLYKETKEDSTLLANSAILTNFKDSLAQTAEGVRYEVSEKEQDAFTLDATAQMVLSSDQIYLDSLEQAIMALDTLAAINNDSLAAVQKEALFANLEQQDIVYKATLQSYEQAKLLKVALAKNENAATTSMEQYEQNDKEITDIFLNTIAVNNTDFSGSEATTLQSIAAQCPLIGGPAVYRARAIYEKIQHIEYNDVATCLSQGISYRKPKPTANISATNQFSLRPNPANDFVTINSIELITEPIKVEIVDLLGKTVTLANLLAGQKSVDIPTSSLTAGVYTCRLSNGIALKLVIVH